MTPEFEPLFRDRIAELKAASMEPEDALREAERYCGRNNEEFNPDGRGIVAEVYGGKFVTRPGGGGMAFIPSPVDATPADEAPKDVAPADVIAEPTPELKADGPAEEKDGAK